MSSTPPPGGNWTRIDTRADGDLLIEEAMVANMRDYQRVVDSETNPELRALLERNRSKIERQIREMLVAEMDRAWARHLRDEGRLG